MSDYSTISVPRRVKETLEKDKGDRDWGEYLLKLYEEAKERRRAKAFRELKKLLTSEDLDKVLKESRKFREGFKFR